MKIIDFHARLVPRPGAAGQLLSTMDRHGIARAVVSAGGVVDLDRLSAQLVEGGHLETSPDNDTVSDACADTDGRLVPFWFANPYADEAVYRKRAYLFRGLELSPAVHGVGFTDPRTVALVRVAADVGHPVYTVCVGRTGCRATDLVRLARRFPTVAFVFGHCGFTGIDTHGIATIAGQDNVHAETSGAFTVTARVALDRLGPDRVLFGTEYPLQDPGVELAKWTALGPDPGVWEKVAWRNAHRLLGEDSP